MIRILLVEDHATFRSALAFVLTHEPDLEVIAQAGSLAEAREALDGGLDGRLDVAVIDLALPDGDGSDLIGELRRSNPGISVVVLSATIWAGSVEEVAKAGADAVLGKVQSPSTIAHELRRLAGKK
jgi:DNA-binding NarL/FixJ family response regulator